MTAILIDALVSDELTRVRTERDTAENINTSYQQQNRINLGEHGNAFGTYAVIPQHLMDEMSMNTGLTNISTVNVAV